MFIHLRLHTEFSVVDGTNRIDDAVAAAQADGQPALAREIGEELQHRVDTRALARAKEEAAKKAAGKKEDAE